MKRKTTIPRSAAQQRQNRRMKSAHQLLHELLRSPVDVLRIYHQWKRFRERNGSSWSYYQYAVRLALHLVIADERQTAIETDLQDTLSNQDDDEDPYALLYDPTNEDNFPVGERNSANNQHIMDTNIRVYQLTAEEELQEFYEDMQAVFGRI